MPVIQVYLKDALYKDIITLDSKVRSKIIVAALTEVAAGIVKPKMWGGKRAETDESWQALRQKKLDVYMQSHSIESENTSAYRKKIIKEIMEELGKTLAPDETIAAQKVKIKAI